MKKKSMPVKGKAVPNTAKSGNKYTHAGAPSAQHLSPGGTLPGTQSAKGVDVDMCGTGMKHPIKPSSPSFK